VIGPGRWTGIVTGLRQEAAIAGALGRAAAGGGRKGGAEAAARLLADAGADALLSFGLAGGLDPSLPPGTLLVPRVVLDQDEQFFTDPGLAAQLGGGIDAPLLAVPNIVARMEEKRRLHQATRAASVDQESGAVARVAARRGLPFAVLRAVCDPAWRSLPHAALVALRPDGSLDVPGLLSSLARRPGDLPALLALARDAVQARKALVGRVHQIGRGGGLLVA